MHLQLLGYVSKAINTHFCSGHALGWSTYSLLCVVVTNIICQVLLHVHDFRVT